MTDPTLKEEWPSYLADIRRCMGTRSVLVLKGLYKVTEYWDEEKHHIRYMHFPDSRVVPKVWIAYPDSKDVYIKRWLTILPYSQLLRSNLIPFIDGFEVTYLLQKIKYKNKIYEPTDEQYEDVGLFRAYGMKLPTKRPRYPVDMFY